MGTEDSGGSEVVGEVASEATGEESGATPEGGYPLDWQPVRSRAGLVGVALTLVLAAGATVAWVYAVGRPIAIDSFAAVVAGAAGTLLALACGILTYGYYSMRYRLGERDLTISWLWTREIIPLGRVDGVYGGHRFGKRVEVEGLNWLGHHVGTAAAESVGRTRFYGTTTEPSAAIIVGTPDRAYGITPAALGEFQGRLIQRLEALPEEEIEAAPEPATIVPRLLRLSLLRDGVCTGLLAAALVVLLGSFGYVSFRFPTLPELMPLHFNFAGEPDLIGPPMEAFRVPAIGALILVANWVVAAAIHGWQRDASRILAGATAFVQLVVLMAVLQVVH